ncbi:aldose epimerase [Thauera sp. 27]|uniref:hypothetical protein n=1 Tax=Thauera sp. 27 TaxID=305700 RepID=UPI0002CFE641|nr:hypothetical protein [Thauera sp. 27]ENO81404.1 aldose epimerase [Thauera sp. 27]
MRLSLSERKPRPSTTPASAGGTPACGDVTECERGRQPRFRVKASHFGDIEGVVLCDEEEGAYAPLEARPGLTFCAGGVLGRAVIDACLAGLMADEDELIHSRLRDPVRGCGLTVWQQGGLVHLFTGDTLERGAWRSVTIEPVETMTDAFNRADCEVAISLPPGAARSFRCGVRFEAAMQPLVVVTDAMGWPRTKAAGHG